MAARPRECLRTAPRQPLVEMRELDAAGRLRRYRRGARRAAAHGATKLDESFDSDGVRLRLSLPADRVDALEAHACATRPVTASASSHPSMTRDDARARMSRRTHEPSSCADDDDTRSQGADRSACARCGRSCSAHRNLFVAWLLALACSSTATLSLPVAFRRMIDQGFTQRRQHRPRVRVPVRGRARARAGDRRALLLRVAARRTRRRRHAPAAVFAPASAWTPASTTAPAAANWSRA